MDRRVQNESYAFYREESSDYKFYIQEPSKMLGDNWWHMSSKMEEPAPRSPLAIDYNLTSASRWEPEEPGPSCNFNNATVKTPSPGLRKPVMPGKKMVSQTVRSYRERRSAYRIVNRLKFIPEDELCREDKNSLAWARNIVNKRELNNPSVPFNQQKSVQKKAFPSYKKAKVGHPLVAQPEVSEVVKDQLIWAVIDKSKEDGRISAEDWKIVESALLKLYSDILREFPGPPPRCCDAGWHQGCVKLIRCADQRSAELYQIAITRLGEVWPGSRLEAVSREAVQSILNKPTFNAWIPAEPSDPVQILQLIRWGNPNLPTYNWKVFKMGAATGNSRQITLVLNRESIPLLLSNKGEISYGFGSIVLNICDLPVAVH